MIHNQNCIHHPSTVELFLINLKLVQTENGCLSYSLLEIPLTKNFED